MAWRNAFSAASLPLRRLKKSAKANQACSLVGKDLYGFAQHCFRLIGRVTMVMESSQFQSVVIDCGFFLDDLA
jgi:hypothetical protein